MQYVTLYQAFLAARRQVVKQEIVTTGKDSMLLAALSLQVNGPALHLVAVHIGDIKCEFSFHLKVLFNFDLGVPITSSLSSLRTLMYCLVHTILFNDWRSLVRSFAEQYLPTL